MAINNIFPFAPSAVPPAILNDADYAASSSVANGYVAGTDADAPTMSKAQRQTSGICAGIGQWLADYQSTNVEDNLSPSTLSGMINAALGGAPGTTQAQFDNSTSLATDAFVQRALGNLSGLSAYGINTILTNANIGGIVIPTAPSLTFTLPLSSTSPTGSLIKCNGDAQGVIIQTQGSDVIELGSAGSVSSFNLLNYDSVTLLNDGAGWSVIEGEAHQGASSSFKSSLTSPGYQTLPGYPNPPIMQWGSANSGPGGTAIVTFPEAFPNAIFFVIASCVGSALNSSCINTQVLSLSQFEAFITHSTTGTGANAQEFSWFAMGN